jgi:Sulfotransferase domain
MEAEVSGSLRSWLRGLVGNAAFRGPGGSRTRAEHLHPWFSGLSLDRIRSADAEAKLRSVVAKKGLASPILFLARGHSGTRALARVLVEAGVFMGNVKDPDSLNPTLDATYWAFGFQRTLVPRLFEYGVGCRLQPTLVASVGLECLEHHLAGYRGGPWGFKTCAGVFSHSLYKYLFSQARYIRMVRDGRDVVLSGNGRLYLTGGDLGRRTHWDYFKIITFGISDDTEACPFEFPRGPDHAEELIRHRFWMQAKCWREHVRMDNHLEECGELLPRVYTVRYEDLCADPVRVLEGLFEFLELTLTTTVKEFARSFVRADAVGRWRDYGRFVTDCDEDMERVFDSMKPELQLLGYEV